MDDDHRELTLEHRAAIRKAQLKKPTSGSVRAKIAAAQIGRQRWPDEKRRLSEAAKLVVTSAEIRADRRAKARRLYDVQQLSMEEIAVRLGWSPTTISKDLNQPYDKEA
jgi:DNA-directed RNA polymerase specialized sigma24 family protein